jgi:hypothetical protein
MENCIYHINLDNSFTWIKFNKMLDLLDILETLLIIILMSQNQHFYQLLTIKKIQILLMLKKENQG